MKWAEALKSMQEKQIIKRDGRYFSYEHGQVIMKLTPFGILPKIPFTPSKDDEKADDWDLYDWKKKVVK